MELEVRILGIPAIARVTYFQPRVPARRHGHPDTWEPAIEEELEFELLDRRGRPAPWLERKLTPPLRSLLREHILREIKRLERMDD